MRRQTGLLCVVLAGALMLAVAPAGAADLTLKRVVLSTGGVGYFEYEAQVEGNASLSLDVPLEQVDDVLKSLVVYDSGGSAGAITLPGREPLVQSFADLPFDRAALNSASALLNALQGAEIRVTAPKAISGRLVHAEDEVVRLPGGNAETRLRVSVMTDEGLQQFLLQDVGSLAFADPQLQRQVETALTRVAQYRAGGRRQLALSVRGSGTRNVRVGYVVAMPLWKASYRLSLPADPKAATARLQGWAVLENFSGQAWQNIELTLLSGNPVTFRQALYESYYVQRPVVPVESGARVLPPPDTGALPGGAFARDEMKKAENTAQRQAMVAGLAAAKPLSAPAAAPPAEPAQLETAAAVEDATQVAFTPPYKISVAAGQSLVLPLIDRELPARRVDLYQETVDRRHPLAAVELINKSDSGLPPGVLTLYQQGEAHGALYLGDARLAALPAGDKRLLSYAVDNKVTVDRETSERRPIVKAMIGDGLMRLSRAIHWTTAYRVKAAAAPPHLLLEQRRRPGAALSMPDPKTVELTADAYRIPLTLAANGEGSLAVVEEQPVEETIRLLDLDDQRLSTFVSSSELDQKLRRVLGDLAARRQAVGRQRADLGRQQEQRKQLVEDERRLRDNLAAVGSDPTLHKQLVDKFTTSETAIDALSATIAKASDALAAAERDLASFTAGLTL